MNEKLFVSREFYNQLKQFPSDNKNIRVGEFSFPIVESSLFPFEINYDACDLVTRREIKIPSGEWCHAAIIPQSSLSLKPFSPYINEFENEIKKNSSRRLFMDKR